MTSTPKLPAEIEKLIEEVEDLCRVWVGKNADGEQWGQMTDRFERLDKLTKKIRKLKGG